jgi:hypothetical protein
VLRLESTHVQFGNAEAGAGYRRPGRWTAARIGKIAAILGAPMLLFAYSSSPPLALTGAPGEGTCASCHGSLTAGSGVTMTFPSSLTYTPGGAAESLTVAASGGAGGFELSARVSSNNGQAGSFTAGTGSGVGTSGSIQYAYQTSRATSWTLQWTPPATNVGNVMMYVVGVSANGQTYSNTYTLTPASGGTTTGTGNTLTATPATLTFNYAGGAAPAAQPVHTSSSGSSIAFITAVSTTSGGSWLSATPSGGSTPLDVSVSVNPAGLAAGAYSGMVTITSSSASNSPQTVNVTLNVTTTAPPATPTLSLNPASLTFTSTGGASVTPKNVMMSSSGSQLPFTTSVSTTSGGNWLSAGAMNGTTPATLSISANPAGLNDGTYKGSVTFTAAGASNSPLTLNVTLIVGPVTPPPTTTPDPVTYSFNVLDRQSDGSDYMMLDGSGSSSNGQITGTGHFTRFSIAADGTHQTVAMGTWTAKSFVSFSASTAGSTSGGVLEIDIELDPTGGTPSTGSLRIADTGSDKGVTLTIDSGSTFNPSGTGSVSVGSGTSGGSCLSPAPIRRRGETAN